MKRNNRLFAGGMFLFVSLGLLIFFLVRPGGLSLSGAGGLSFGGVDDVEKGAVVETIPGQYIVVLQDGLTSSDVELVLEQAAQVVLGAETSAAGADAETLERAGIAVSQRYDAALIGFAGQLSDAAVQALHANPAVLLIEQDQVIRVGGSQTGASWGLDRIDQTALPLNSKFDYRFTGTGVHAYIIDTGIRSTHSQFSGRMGNGYSSLGGTAEDCNGHGTHVAGIVGGTTYGVAKGVTLHAVRVLDCNGSGTASGVIAGINWVISNRIQPAVANMSLGGGASAALDAAVDSAVNAGVTMVLAAGNENSSACNASPARVAAGLTVGATTNTDARSSFSNYGTCLDLFAPGQSITSAWMSSDTATNTISGTSMAAPFVAGAAVLYRQEFPAASVAQTVNFINTSATAGKVTNPGTGSPNRLLYVSSTVQSVQPTVTPTPAPVVNLANGNFDAGRVNWFEVSSNGYALIDNRSPFTPLSPAYLAWLGGVNNETSEVRQTVTLPSGTNYLRYSYYLKSSDYCSYDYMRVLVTQGTTRTVLKVYNVCSSANTAGWVSAWINLSAYAGKPITIIFQATTDSSLISSMLIDNVSLSTTQPTGASELETPDMALPSGEKSVGSEGFGEEIAKPAP